MTDLGIATLSAEVAGGGTQALLANAARALTVADETARADLALIVTALNNVLVELGQKLEPGQAVALDSATLAALESITAAVTGSVSVTNLPATQPVSATALPLPAGAATQTTLAAVLAALALVPVSGPLTDAQIRATALAVSTGLTQPLTDAQLRASKVGVADDYQAGEVLADQSGVGAVLTFTFSAAVQLVVIHARGASLTARADPFGGTPSASQGIVCGDDAPTYVPVATSLVKVFAPAGMAITVHGMRRT